jgi:hypothetical protein
MRLDPMTTTNAQSPRTRLQLSADSGPNHVHRTRGNGDHSVIHPGQLVSCEIVPFVHNTLYRSMRALPADEVGVD